jgi:uroporphyrinogen decarboxylase
MSEKPLFLRALAKEKVERPPIWFMRQAGRFLPEYRAVREKHEFLEVCKTPELACEVTLQPIRRFGFDASIVFSDILVIPEAMGQTLTFGKGMGPKLEPTIRSTEDIDKLPTILDPTDKLGYVAGAVKAIVAELPENVPLIGFSGAPYTNACYMIEGQGSKTWVEVKRLMYTQPEAMDLLLDKLATSTIDYLLMQIEAGTRAVQIFDTWASELSPDDLVRYALNPVKKIIAGVRAKAPDTPIIYFPRGCADTLDLVKQVGADCYGLDWRARISKAWETLGDVAVQGNLDPAALFGPADVIKRKTRDILDDVGGRPGHVFNLGHGIMPKTPIESVEACLEEIRG